MPALLDSLQLLLNNPRNYIQLKNAHSFVIVQRKPLFLCLYFTLTLSLAQFEAHFNRSSCESLDLIVLLSQARYVDLNK